jgi:hypothetical protein
MTNLSEYELISGPQQYAKAGHYAREAAEAERIGDRDRAYALAAIGQVRATSAMAAATTLDPNVSDYGTYRAWQQVADRQG